ncbi:putative type VI secretion system effector [Hafnia alvei]|uniref:putative type VI secretion system effector n=1 Tax=Hafnia alvei TaxID=569 RepID=UPI00345C91C9
MIRHRNVDEYIDFEEIASRREDIETEIVVKNKRIERVPEEREEIEAQIESLLNKDIPDVDALLATAPPAPELPPRKRLVKVAGIVEEIDVMKVVGYFQEREYDPEAFAKHEENEQVGALLLAMIGNAAGSAVTSQSSIRMRSYCDFIRGKINGKLFYGWLGKTNIQVGDYVEMAAMEKNGEYVIYAVTHPDRRTISVTPNCDQGLDGYIKSCRLYVRFVISFIILLFFIPLAWNGALTLRILMYMVLFWIVAEPIIYFISDRLERKNPKQNYVLAGLIFEALGFKEPTEVDLIKITKKKLKSKEMPSKQNEPDWPDRECTVNYYYYY